MDIFLQLAAAASILTGNLNHYEPPTPLPPVAAFYLHKQQLKLEAERAKVVASPKTTPHEPLSARGVSVSGDGVWDRLAQCESGSDPAKNTGNGYYGLLQFSIPTWNAMGTGYARADLAPASVQIAAGQKLQARSGWGQWPGCARKLGLL